MIRSAVPELYLLTEQQMLTVTVGKLRCTAAIAAELLGHNFDRDGSGDNGRSTPCRHCRPDLRHEGWQDEGKGRTTVALQTFLPLTPEDVACRILHTVCTGWVLDKLDQRTLRFSL